MKKKQKKFDVEKELKTKRIDIRCTPKQKQIYLDNGGSILFTKVLDEIAKK
tara:strand:+ start:180 stop:332 length:153 start_codon:yes stop_codon:yes gene_type:complete